ncbi:unnamed protein product [Caenorhabditis sp. 36 PRJEB53466]|nr:unnamed protein product [Caenorhabditis sp. 36 PRJEB53466]
MSQPTESRAETSHENINSPIDSLCSSDTSSKRSDSGTDSEEDYQSEFEEDCYTERNNKAILDDTMKYDERMASWAKLSDEDLSRMYFLLSTTQSRRAISTYFDCTEVANKMNMKKNIVTGAFDDPARRKIFGLKGHSSKGSRAFCLLRFF